MLLIDAGKGGSSPNHHAGDILYEARKGVAKCWDRLLGRSFGQNNSGQNVSPKLRIHTTGRELPEWARINRIKASGFTPIGMNIAGGLSRIWGAMTPILTDDELTELGLPIKEIHFSYSRVVSRIGISGSIGNSSFLVEDLQPPLSLSLNATALLSACRSRAKKGIFRLERPLQAVLSQPKEGRGACISCGGCLWGCSEGAIYDAAVDLDDLRSHPLFKFQGGSTVRRLVRESGEFQIEIEGSHGNSLIVAANVVLAAGHLPTSRLVLEYLGVFDRSFRFYHAPAFAFAVIHPRKIGSAITEHDYGMAQLAFESDMSEDEIGRTYGTIYDATSVAPSDIFSASPLGLNSVATVARTLMPTISIVLGYLPGHYSENYLTLTRENGEAWLQVEGKVSREQARRVSKSMRVVSRSLAQLGAYRIPGSYRMFMPGTEAHAGASLGSAEMLKSNGEVKGAPGLYVVDTSALSAIPARHPTFTAIANADRIGLALAANLIAGRNLE